MHPAISVIVPCYNQEAYIGECIDSILKQSFNDYEIIVINDGSKDNSVAIVESYVSRYGNKIRLINQENDGVIAARNNGIRAATGRYLLPVDGDDKLADDCLGGLYRAMEDGLGDVIYGDTTCFGTKSGKLYLPEPTKWNMMLDNCMVVTALYRKSDAEKYNGYDPYMKKGLEDWEFWLNYIEEGKTFYHIGKDVLHYRIAFNSRNTSFNKKDFSDLYQYIKTKHKRLFKLLFLAKLRNFLYRRKITNSGRRITKICKVPVWASKL